MKWVNIKDRWYVKPTRKSARPGGSGRVGAELEDVAPRIQPFAVGAGGQGAEAPAGGDLDRARREAQLVRSGGEPLQLRESRSLGA